MPAKIPQLKALLAKSEEELEQLTGRVESLRAKIKDKTKKSRKAQSQRKKKEKREKKEKEEKEKKAYPSLASTTDIASTTIDVEAQRVEAETSEDVAERQEEIQKVTESLAKTWWTEANEAKATAEKAVQKLKSLRAKGNTGHEDITAARLEVQSSLTRATELEIAAILAEDDVEAIATRNAATGEAAVVDVAHGSVEDDSDSLGPWATPSPPSNDFPLVPEFYGMPTAGRPRKRQSEGDGPHPKKLRSE